MFEKLKSLILTASGNNFSLWLSVNFDADYLKVNQKLNQNSCVMAFFIFAAYPGLYTSHCTGGNLRCWQELSITGRPELKYFSLWKQGTAKSCAQRKLSACLFIFHPKAFIHVQSIYTCSRKKEYSVWGLLLSASFISGILIAPHGFLAISEL